MTTYFTTYIDLPAPLKDIEALLERLSDVDSNEAFIGVVESRDGDRLEVSYSSDDLIKKRTSTGPHLRIEKHVITVDGDDLAEHIARQKKRADTLGFADRRNTAPRHQQPRDHLGRFTKRK